MKIFLGVFRMDENLNQNCQLWNAKTFGLRLSLSKRQIFRLNSCAKIPAPIRIGGAVRWDSQEVSDWLAAGAPDRKTWEQMKGAQ
jgi:predicted DNA-binding transcriptional regulator AlpA